MSEVSEVLPVLSGDERERLEVDEQVIAQGLRKFRETGEALLDIQQARLYRATHATFEDYLKGRWEMSKSYGYRMIDAFKAARAIESETSSPTSPIGDVVPNESVARVLAQAGRDGVNEIDEEKVSEAWHIVVEAYEEEAVEPEKPITASFAKRVLTKAGAIADTRGAAGTPNWGELIGAVGDSLKAAQKHLVKAEKAIGQRDPGKRNAAKAETYAEWADDISNRLREMAS